MGIVRTVALMILVIACASRSAHSQDITLTVSASAEPVPAGGPAKFSLNALNTLSHPISWSFPATLRARLASPTTIQEISAELLDLEQNRLVTIQPGAFARREYGFAMPANWLGTVTLELPDVPSVRLLLKVEPPKPDATDAGTGKGLLYLLKGREQAREAAGYDPDDFFKEHIFGYEPFYFIGGTESPNAKFQFSFKYKLFNDHGRFVRRFPWLTGSYFAFTQTSLWDLSGDSAPFFDSSYRPEFFYSRERLVGGDPDDWFRFDMQGGFQHESNGKEGADSRSMNFVYLRPTLVFGRETGLQLTLIARGWGYVGDLSDNQDMPNYRGYADLRAILGWKRGLQVSALGRMGKRGNHRALQLDVTYPLMQPPSGSFSIYLQAQYFTGYGESLIGYNEKTDTVRFGISLYR